MCSWPSFTDAGNARVSFAWAQRAGGIGSDRRMPLRWPYKRHQLCTWLGLLAAPRRRASVLTTLTNPKPIFIARLPRLPHRRHPDGHHGRRLAPARQPPSSPTPPTTRPPCACPPAPPPRPLSSPMRWAGPCAATPPRPGPRPCSTWRGCPPAFTCCAGPAGPNGWW